MYVMKKRFPVSSADFPRIRERDMYYVDKTDLAWRIANECDIAFLARPRRFGKSMLLSTMACYLRGQRELFEGLRIEDLEAQRGEKAWTKHPVLRYDFSGIMRNDIPSIEMMMRNFINDELERWGLDQLRGDETLNLHSAIKSLVRASGQRVAVLIDEYDSPLLDAMLDGKLERFDEIREYLRGFYKTLKMLDGDIRFIMLTGVSQIRQVGVFSGFNNLKDISFHPEYSAVCGISEREMHEFLQQPLEDMAAEWGVTTEEALDALRRKYDGYRFACGGEDVYNPFGLINALEERRLKEFWVLSGTPRTADELIPKYSQLGVLDLEGNIVADELSLSQFDPRHIQPVPFLYQTGYLTIKESIGPTEHRLGLPNEEVRQAILGLMVPRTLGIIDWNEQRRMEHDLFDAVRGQDVKRFQACLQALLAMLPFDSEGSSEEATKMREYRFRDALHLIFTLLGARVQVEQHGAGGISDVEIVGPRMVLVLELKLAGGGITPEGALRQVAQREYTTKHIGGERDVWAIGAVMGERCRIEWREERVWEGKTGQE